LTSGARQPAFAEQGLRIASKSRKITSSKQNRGITMARNVVRMEPIASSVATRKFPYPPVVAEDAPLRSAVPVWITPAVPPPAMMARDHLRKGFMFPTREAVTMGLPPQPRSCKRIQKVVEPWDVIGPNFEDRCRRKGAESWPRT
jgi:hypothetical protein